MKFWRCIINIVILAAGSGSRLKPLTNNLPKCLVEINNIPIIDSILVQFSTVDKIQIVLGPFRDKIIKHINDYWGHLDISFVGNDFYKESNTLYSSSLGFPGKPKLVLDSDVCWKTKIPFAEIDQDKNYIFGIVGEKEGETEIVSTNGIISEFKRSNSTQQRVVWGGGVYLNEETSKLINDAEMNNDFIEDFLIKKSAILNLLKLENNGILEIDDLNDAIEAGININVPSDLVSGFSSWYFNVDGEIELFSKGLSSFAYKLKNEFGEFIVNIPKFNRDFPEGTSRKHKRNVMELLKSNVYDHHVAYIPSLNIKISKFLSGRQAEVYDIPMILDELRKVWELKSGVIFDPISKIEKYIKNMQYVERAKKIHSVNLTKKLSLIHGDMNSGNAIIVGNKAKLIDFDYSYDYTTDYDIAVMLVNFRVKNFENWNVSNDDIFLAATYHMAAANEYETNFERLQYIDEYKKYLMWVIDLVK